MLCKEDQAILATLSQLMATKTEEPILNIKGWVSGQTAIAVTRLYSQMLHGYQVPSPLWNQEPDWESGLGLGLVQ